VRRHDGRPRDDGPRRHDGPTRDDGPRHDGATRDDESWIIFALIDSDGDGTISLQEWQAAHEKIFKAMDTDKDGTVSFEEMMNFMQGSKRPTPQH
jgi:Ca2+-binding EF-hand superfamily protein